MIISVGVAADETFVYGVASLASTGVPVAALDLVQLAYSGTISLRLDTPLESTIDIHGELHELGAFSGAWVRMIDISREAPSDGLRRRAADQYHALSLLLDVVPFPVVNRPMCNASNFAKLAHAAALSPLIGVPLPRFCLTSNPEEARVFIEDSPDGVIFKGASGQKTWATAYSPSEHAERLALLPHCPTLFQERIDGPDVRVHIVRDAVFGEVIESTVVDYRTNSKNVYCHIAVPSEVKRGCVALVEHLNVPFLGIDFKIQRATGRWFFLEANSAPCYQGYDRRAAGAISSAIADYLI